MQFQPLDQLRAERKAEQWVQSIVAYLEWRGGLPWIAYVRFRFHPEVQHYVECVRVVNFAWTEPEPVCKKLPQSLKRAA